MAKMITERFWTIGGRKAGGIATDADHVSGFVLRTSVANGTKLKLSFTRDTSKAMRFNDLPAARTALNALRLFMRGGLQQYDIIPHHQAKVKS